MERIWRLFTAAIATVFAIGLLLFCFSMCLWAGTTLTNVVNWSLGGIGLPLRIPLTIMFSIASGYIFLSLVLGNEGYFNSEDDRKIHRGSKLSDASKIRGSMSNVGTASHSSRSSVPNAFRQFEQDNKLGELLLELLNPFAWIPPRLAFWRKANRKTPKKPGGLR